jgi:ribose transport system ATP-binding protein
VGSGRTETVRAIFGADRAVAGTVRRDGVAVAIRNPRDALQHGICLVTEDRKDEGLVLDMPIRTIITLAQLAGFARAGWLDRTAERRASEQMVDKLDIRLASVEQPPRELSGGNQQKVVLARWDALNQPVLVLEEPTAGVDVGAKRQIYELLCQRADAGSAIVVVSTDYEEVATVCTRVLVFRGGRIAAELRGHDITIGQLLALSAGSAADVKETA